MKHNHRKLSFVAAALAVSLAMPAGLLSEISPARSAQTDRDSMRGAWTVLTMAPDGSWGTATDMSIGRAIAGAIANCKEMNEKQIGCGARQTSIRAGWSLAFRCGDENIIVAAMQLADAQQAAIARENELRQVYGRVISSCTRILTVDPQGVVVNQGA